MPKFLEKHNLNHNFAIEINSCFINLINTMKLNNQFYSNLNLIALSLMPIVKQQLAANIITNIVFWGCAIAMCTLDSKRRRNSKNKYDPEDLNPNYILSQFAIMGYAIIIAYIYKDLGFVWFWFGLVILEMIYIIILWYNRKKLKGIE